MTRVEAVKVESDEQGFELHLWIDSDLAVAWPDGRIVLNIHSVALDLLEAVKSEIGPWAAEGAAAHREWRTGIADDPAQQEVLDRIREGRGR